MEEYPQIRTTIMENVIPVSTVIDAPWVSVTSLNGMTGDVIVEPVVNSFTPNHPYVKDNLISYDGVLYTAKENFTSGSTFDPEDWNVVGGSTTIPIATDTVLGGIKVGNNLSITQDGTLSADAQQVTLYNTTGQNTDGAMTQKATTDEFEKVSYIGDTIPGQAPLIETTDIADGAVTSAKIANGTIATSDIANEAITSDKIANGTIATTDIADSAITSAKIDHNGINVEELIYTRTFTSDQTSDQTVIIPIDFTTYKKITLEASYEPLDTATGWRTCQARDANGNVIACVQTGIEFNPSSAWIYRQQNQVISHGVCSYCACYIKIEFLCTTDGNHPTFEAKGYGGDETTGSVYMQNFLGKIRLGGRDIKDLRFEMAKPRSGAWIRMTGVKR